MNTRATQKTQTRQRILDASARAFRKNGYAGIGVDGLARAAGVTSGAFYAHFDSKSAAFDAVIAAGMAQLRQGVLHFQAEFGAQWWPEFVRFYLSTKRTCDLADACTLQTMPSELARGEVRQRQAFEQGLTAVVRAIVQGPPSPGQPQDDAAAGSALAMLIGAVTLSRAVASPALAQQMASAATRALLADAAGGTA